MILRLECVTCLSNEWKKKNYIIEIDAEQCEIKSKCFAIDRDEERERDAASVCQ